MNYVNESLNEFLKSDILINNVMTLYHSSLNKNLAISHAPIHLGTYVQAIDRANDIAITDDILLNQIYLHEITIKIINPYPKILRKIDKNREFQKVSDFTRFGKYNEFMYVNLGEGTDANFFEDGKFDIKNLSLFIVDFAKSFISSKRYKFI